MTKSTSTKSAPLDLDRAIEIFAGGFCFTRSITHPYCADRIGPAVVIRDAPRKNPADYRREEWVVHHVSAKEIDKLARGRTRGRFCICAVLAAGEPDGPLRAEYKEAGYRLGATEAFMAHRLKKLPKSSGPFPVQRMTTIELAKKVGKATGRRPMAEKYLAADSPIRQYVALDHEKPIGWAKSITVGDCTWVSDVFVNPKYRRRGIGRSILVEMLKGDRAHGSRQSVLLASHTGALLYSNIGYETIGTLFVYTPIRK